MLKLTWKYVKPLQNSSAIEDFETKYNVSFPSDLKSILKEYNNGRPSLKIFDSETSKEHEFKKLLSFNASDTENIYDFMNADRIAKGFVPFANDPAGNLIGLYNGEIYYWLSELEQVEFLADSFTEFLNKLYDA